MVIIENNFELSNLFGLNPNDGKVYHLSKNMDKVYIYNCYNRQLEMKEINNFSANENDYTSIHIFQNNLYLTPGIQNRFIKINLNSMNVEQVGEIITGNHIKAYTSVITPNNHIITMPGDIPGETAHIYNLNLQNDKLDIINVPYDLIRKTGDYPPQNSNKQLFLTSMNDQFDNIYGIPYNAKGVLKYNWKKDEFDFINTGLNFRFINSVYTVDNSIISVPAKYLSTPYPNQFPNNSFLMKINCEEFNVEYICRGIKPDAQRLQNYFGGISIAPNGLMYILPGNGSNKIYEVNPILGNYDIYTDNFYGKTGYVMMPGALLLPNGSIYCTTKTSSNSAINFTQLEIQSAFNSLDLYNSIYYNQSN